MDRHDSAQPCPNCGYLRSAAYCGHCGQAANIHRTISAFWHDLSHSVLHFDGKFWRTMPLLAWKPGELTRRYIQGERTKFISPMALFLFAVFMMFAIFSFLPSSDIGGLDIENEVAENMSEIETQIDASQVDLSAPDISAQKREELNAKIADLKERHNGLSYLNDMTPKYAEYDARLKESKIAADPAGELEVGNGWANDFIKNAFLKAKKNPDLVLYKLKANGYKFAWLLVPISIPFIWLVTIGVRGHRFYDHAVFTTYSLSAMTMLFILTTLAVTLDILAEPITLLATLYAGFHLYRQLRHAYGLSRIGTIIRLTFLLFFIAVALLIFLLILLFLGALG